MSKYSKMLEVNRRENQEKIDIAIQAIRELVDKEEPLVVCELVRKTGLSRAYFYKNPVVSQFLCEERKKQDGKVFYGKKKVVLDYALEKQNQLIKQQLDKLKKENEELKKENEKLKKSLKKKEISFIKGL